MTNSANTQSPAQTFTKAQAIEALTAAGFTFDAATCEWSNGEVTGRLSCVPVDFTAVVASNEVGRSYSLRLRQDAANRSVRFLPILGN